MTLASGGGGESDLPACGLPAIFSVITCISKLNSGNDNGDNVFKLIML